MTERKGLDIYLTTFEAAPSRPWTFRGGCIRDPCGRPALLLRREGLLRAAAGLILPLKEGALAAVPVLGASEEHPVQLQRPSKRLRKRVLRSAVCQLPAMRT